MQRSCQQCGEKFNTMPSRLKKGEGKYCSRACSSKARNKKSRRSCLQCGKEFFVSPSVARKGSGRYCSVGCRASGVQKTFIGKKNPFWKGGGIERTCKVCGARFKAKPSEVKKGCGQYCSLKCRGLSVEVREKIGRANGKKKAEIICIVCKKSFKVHPCRAGAAKFCSRRCLKLGKRKRVKRICQACGNGFESKPSDVKAGNGKYCSIHCKYIGQKERMSGDKSPVKRPEVRRKISEAHRGKKKGPYSLERRRKISEAQRGPRFERTCSACNKKFLVKQHEVNSGRRFCSKRCKYEYMVSENSPSWQGGKSFEIYPPGWTEALRSSIRSRDNHVCQICGTKQGDRTLHVHHIDYDKGNFDPKNLISLCAACHGRTNRVSMHQVWRRFLSNKVKQFYRKNEIKVDEKTSYRKERRDGAGIANEGGNNGLCITQTGLTGYKEGAC